MRIRFFQRSSSKRIAACLGALALLFPCSCQPPIRMNLTPAVRHERKDPMAAAGALLDQLNQGQRQISRGDTGAILEYNHLVARLVEELERAHVEPWYRTVSLPAAGGGVWHLRGNEPAGFDAYKRRFVATDTLSFSGRHAPDERILQEGLGATLVAAMPDKVDYRKAEVPPFEYRFRSATAVLSLRGNQALLEMMDPFETRSVRFAGRDYPLAADFSSTLALAASRERIDKLAKVRLLDPGRYANTAGLNFLQPYDPQRIPVVLVHGLQDTPATWLPAYLGLMRDPVVRERCQFWAFSYPSGYPFPYSASLLQNELNRVKHRYPNHKDIVLVGHSMGGILCRLMITDTGDSLWKSVFGKSPSETPMNLERRSLLEKSLVFKARRDVSRTVFIATPHRGAELAATWYIRIVSRLVRIPAFMAEVQAEIVDLIQDDEEEVRLNRPPTAIDTLMPGNRLFRAIKDLKIKRGIPCHSIIGDRGREGNPADSSDGIVAYWSSHLEGVESETLVPSNHMAHQHAEGIAELRRILRLHVAAAP